MSTTSFHPAAPFNANPRGAMRGLGRSILFVFEALATAGPRSAELSRLVRMSDEQLQARGLTRDGIVSHVYGDLL